MARNDQMFTMIGKEPEENGSGKTAHGEGPSNWFYWVLLGLIKLNGENFAEHLSC